MNARQQDLANSPVDGVVVELAGTEYVAGDATFTCWMRRSDGVTEYRSAITDRLDRELMSRRAGAR